MGAEHQTWLGEVGDDADGGRDPRHARLETSSPCRRRRHHRHAAMPPPLLPAEGSEPHARARAPLRSTRRQSSSSAWSGGGGATTTTAAARSSASAPPLRLAFLLAGAKAGQQPRLPRGEARPLLTDVWATRSVGPTCRWVRVGWWVGCERERAWFMMPSPTGGGCVGLGRQHVGPGAGP